MKFTKLIAVMIAGWLAGCSTPAPAPKQEIRADDFLGMWALDLDYENSNAGWLEVRQENGYLDADILWRWGSVEPAEFVFVAEGELFLEKERNVIRERDESGKPLKAHHLVYWYDIKKDGNDRITGTLFTPNENGIGVESVAFSGTRIPPPGEAPDLSKIQFGEPVTLFNGRDLEGWELTDKNAASGWSVVDGILINDPVQKEGEPHISYGNLRTRETFSDFRLEIGANVPEGSNSGIYLRGIYEVQVVDSYGRELDPHNMGALYSRITPSVAAEKPAGEWQTFDITLYKRHLTVILNGVKIIDNQPVKGVTGGALTSDEFSPGPLYLQGDHGKVSYRDIVLTPILD
jgi:hypothetical protein